MKKLLVGLFLFSFLFVGIQAHAEDPSITITVISPNNGFESIESGSKVEIQWTTTNIVGAVVDVYVSDGLHTGQVLRVNNTGNTIYTLDASLIPGSNYRAYVSLNPSGLDLIDSSDHPFTIKSSSASTSYSLPTFSNIHNITNETSTSAVVSGTILSDGGSNITSRGIVWSKSSDSMNPTIANYRTLNGIGAGYFSGTMTGLTPNTDYSVRLYAINNDGLVYSDYMSFSTLATASTSVKVMQPYAGSVLTQGGQNIISWTGGKNKVQIGVFNNNYGGGNVGTYSASHVGLIGYIELNGSPASGSTTWDGITLRTLDGSRADDLAPGSYRIVAISESDTGNYCIGDVTSCNSNLTELITVKAATVLYDYGCSYGAVYSLTTGQLCPKILDANDGCYGARFSVTTGKACPLSMVTEEGCSYGAVYSYTTGNKCPIINAPICPANMPNPLALCSDGRIEAATKDANNCTTSFRCTNPRNDLGCKNREIYSTVTKQLCPIVTIDSGCTSTSKYSSTTGQACLGKIPEVDGGCNGTNKYSITTGQICSNYNGSSYPNTTSIVASSTITTPITRTLKLGIKGDDVKTLQEFLNLLADGSFGPMTQAKVIEWQAQNGLTPDGAFGYYSRQKAGLE